MPHPATAGQTIATRPPTRDEPKMNLSPILKRFMDKAPLPVMMRAVLERELDKARLDQWFEEVAQQQYTRKLLFSTLFELMTQMAQMAQWLLAQAALISLKRYAKAPARKTAPKPATKRVHNPRKPHVSLTKLLAGAP